MKKNKPLSPEWMLDQLDRHQKTIVASFEAGIIKIDSYDTAVQVITSLRGRVQKELAEKKSFWKWFFQ